jgi:hypothetical protein
MKSEERWSVILFASSSHALRAERVLREAAIEVKLIPVPRQLSSDCGLCLRIPREIAPGALAILVEGRAPFDCSHAL